jgi:hypothetical protein
VSGGAGIDGQESVMITLDASCPGYRELHLLAAAWNVSAAEAISRLVDHYYPTSRPTQLADRAAPEPGDRTVSVERLYAGQRIEGRYDPAVGHINVARAIT